MRLTPFSSRCIAFEWRSMWGEYILGHEFGLFAVGGVGAAGEDVGGTGAPELLAGLVDEHGPGCVMVSRVRLSGRAVM